MRLDAHTSSLMFASSVLASLAFVGCADTGASQNGASEDFRVRNAQFLAEPLPGTVPPDAGSKPAAADAGDAALPSIIQVLTSNYIVTQGQGGKKFNGFASTNTYAIAVALDDDTRGHWVQPVGGPDPVMGGLTWDLVTDFGDNISPGHHDLHVVAVDKQGRAGEQATLTVCVAGRIPDNLHACDDSRAPPRAVIALTWDTEVDLDLQVIAPNGVLTDAKHPLTGQRDPSAPPPDDGKLDRDSNASCVIDGIRAESLVWKTTMPHGRYGMYVNLFDSCKQPAVRFKLAVYTAVPNRDSKSGQVLKLWFEKSGELTSVAENGGAARGLFVSEFEFH
jgi:hypothetical protein